MNHDCHNNIVKALKIAEALMETADKGEAASSDDACRVLFGVIRDCGYKILKQAERQRQAHKAVRDRC